METPLVSPFALLRQAWSLALSRPHILPYLILGILPQIISLLVGLTVGTTNLEYGWGVTGVIAIGLIIVSLVSTWYTALLYLVYRATASGAVGSLFMYFRPAKDVTLRLLVTYLKIGLITLMGFLLFIIPGIILAVRYSFAPLIATTEDRSVRPIDESKRLVKGRFWKLTGRGLLMVICYNVPLSVLQSVHPLLGMIWAVTSPVFGLYFFLVYLDFKRAATLS